MIFHFTIVHKTFTIVQTPLTVIVIYAIIITGNVYAEFCFCRKNERGVLKKSVHGA